MTAVMAIEGLRLELESGVPIVEDVSLTLPAGRILGLVGESGSGKTTTALALLGYTRPGVRRAGGTITVAGRRIDELEEHELRRVRGSLVSYVPQDPAAALNPSFRVGTQIADMIAQHTRGRDRERVVAALEQVELPSGEDFRRRYPHQLSGGQQQRVAIAISLACEPPLVVLDEPTTGLDVVTQARILDEIRRLRNELAVSMVYVSHDLAVIAAIADEIAVMYAGRIVEIGPTRSVLTSPKHPYTRALVDSIPDHRERRRLHALPGVAVAPGERPVGCAFAPRCSQRVDRCVVELPELEEVGAGHRARCFEWLTTPEPRSEAWQARAFASASAEPLLGVEALGAVHRSREGDVIAADDVTFLVSAGECLALVGESGSGKTTIARCVAGLHPRYTGRISLEGALLAPRAKDRPKQVRGSCQLVFQNPYDSLNPRHRIGDAIARPARLLRDISAADAAVEVSRLLEQVRLPPAVATRYPAELSGGERQRVAIARALATRPRLLICDEITSALDVSVQAAVLEILGDLRAKLGLAMLFITHDLGVVASVADRVLVLDRGVICEEGAVEALLSAPSHEYTRRLVDAAPSLPVREPAAQTRTSRSR